MLTIVLCVALVVCASAEEAAFHSGVIPDDTNGHPVHAHGGHILHIEDLYLWYGVSQKQLDPSTGRWVSQQVNLYTSRQLSGPWRPHGALLEVSDLVPHLPEPLQPPYSLEWPSLLYNAARRLYVLLVLLDASSVAGARGPAAPGSSGAAAPHGSWLAAATSVSPWGPFSVRRVYLPDDEHLMHMTVAQDDAGAYLVRTLLNGTLAISQLADDYLHTAPGGICALAHRCAAPVVFRSNAQWMLLGAQRAVRWEPSAPVLWASDGDALCSGTWQPLPTPAHGPGAATLFDSLPSMVYTHHYTDDQVLHLYLGDRFSAGMDNASYVWLPLLRRPTPGGGSSYELVNVDGWRLSDYAPSEAVK